MNAEFWARDRLNFDDADDILALQYAMYDYETKLPPETPNFLMTVRLTINLLREGINL